MLHVGLRGGGGIDGQIHSAAGPALLTELTRLYPRGGETGSAYPSGAHGIGTTENIIHAIGPDYRAVGTNAQRNRAIMDLSNAYINSLAATVTREDNCIPNDLDRCFWISA